MALGILEPKDEHVAGTVYVYEQARRNADHFNANTTLKRDASGKIILVPQPSDNPNDPLVCTALRYSISILTYVQNWPWWKRDLILATLSLVVVIATTAAPLLAADSVQLALYFKTTFQKAADLTAFHLAGVAVGAVVFVPSARVWGKRHVFLLGALLMCAASAWGGSTHNNRNYTSMVWARVFQGVALAPFESLSNAVVGDLYFVHERGPVSVPSGPYLSPEADLRPAHGIREHGNLWRSLLDSGVCWHDCRSHWLAVVFLLTRNIHGHWLFSFVLFRAGNGVQKSGLPQH